MIRGMLNLRVVGALLCASLVLIVGFAVPATAQDEGDGVLRIVKTLDDGSKPAEPLEGISFQVNRVRGLDPMNPADLSQLAQIDSETLLQKNPEALADPVTQITELQGDRAVAEFSGLSDGVYLVTELPSRAGDVRYSAVSPFFVSIPGGSGRDPRIVEVEAKNQAIFADKQVSLSSATQNSQLHYHISSNVPAPDRSGKLHRYKIVDPLDERVTFDSVNEVFAADVQGMNVEFEAGADYITSYVSENHRVVIEFTEQGLVKLAEARTSSPALVVHTYVQVSINNNASNGERISNTAFVLVDGITLDAFDAYLEELEAQSISSQRVTTMIVDQAGTVGEQPLRPTTIPDPPAKEPEWWSYLPAALFPWIVGITGGLISSSSDGSNSLDGFLPAGLKPGEEQDPDYRHPGEVKDPHGAHGSRQPIKPQDNDPGVRSLAQTGASVITIIITAALLIGFGWWLLVGTRKKRSKREGENDNV